jgi:hypothetical protein
VRLAKATALAALGLLVVASCGGDAIVGGQGGAGAASQGGGGSVTTCAQLEAAYADALAAAQFCDTSINTVLCSELVFTTLECPCAEVFINPDNTPSVTQMNDLRQQFTSAGCGSGACPTIACTAPTNAGCVADGVDATSGACESS